MKLILSLALLACVTLFPAPSWSAPSIACAAQAPSPLKGRWFYRVVDGRKCWYEGKAMISRSQLHWPKPKAAEGETATPSSNASASPAIGANTTRASTDGRNISSAQARPESAALRSTQQSDAWPATPVVSDDGSFESRWRGLISRE
jgi:hypothetical protein